MENKSSCKTQVLVLGVFHFFYPGDGKHAVDTHPADISTPEKQAEILEVVDKLLKFKPTKIAVEAPFSAFDKLNNTYRDYCLNEQSVYSSEIEHRGEIVQLGFRIGKRLNHDSIYPLDYPVDLPFEPAVEYAQNHNPEFMKEFQKFIEEVSKISDEMQNRRTVCEALRHYNDPEHIADDHNIYLDFAGVGAGDTYCGADFANAWYKRNLRIFGNLRNISKPEDRILVIYGAGHCGILREIIGSYKKMQLVDPLEYL